MLSLTYDEISGDTTPPKDNKEKPIVNIGDYDELVGIIVGKIGGDFIFIDNGQSRIPISHRRIFKSQ